MGDPRNPDRAAEVWDQTRIDIIGHEALTTPSPEVQALIDAARKRDRARNVKDTET
jgi:hypothetical protein